ncbi:MAG: hypothetical protein PVF33_10200, partial [Candidatus Latescibacterota bacterium]
PAWGNREETSINVGPLAGAPAGKIAILGGIPVAHIDNVSGLTTASAFFATNNIAVGAGRPFGGRVTVQGAPLLGHKYRVEVTPVGGGAPTTVVKDLHLTRWDGTTYVHSADPVTLMFDYVPFMQNVNGLLAQWDTAGNDKWIVRLYTYTAGGVQTGPPDVHLIQLDNKWPDAQIEITSGTGDCGKFGIGATLSGTYVARDDYLHNYTIHVLPNVNDPGEAIPNPASGTVNTPLSGSTWTLDTTGMKACGYIIRIVARDKAIVNSQSLGHHSPDSAGFCLE